MTRREWPCLFLLLRLFFWWEQVIIFLLILMRPKICKQLVLLLHYLSYRLDLLYWYRIGNRLNNLLNGLRVFGYCRWGAFRLLAFWMLKRLRRRTMWVLTGTAGLFFSLVFGWWICLGCLFLRSGWVSWSLERLVNRSLGHMKNLGDFWCMSYLNWVQILVDVIKHMLQFSEIRFAFLLTFDFLKFVAGKCFGWLILLRNRFASIV
jgi:hypothetical protein